MTIIKKSLTKWSAVLATFLMCAGGVQAATYSTTKVELLYGYDYARGPNFAEENQALFTFANATGFTWGDSFFFIDISDVGNSESTGGSHIEWSPRARIWDGKGIFKAGYVIGQADFDSGKFANKVTKMGGFSLDWNVPGFRFVKTHLQYRDDPTLEGNSTQFTIAWNKGFKIGQQDFSFEGFADWTSSEGTSVANLLTQPVLMWHPTKNMGVGIEYQYWKNRIGIDGLTEKAPQIVARWTF
jgi:hypothetical protein